MILGPFSEFDLSRLTEKLDSFNAHYTIGVSKEELQQSQNEVQTRPLNPNPTYQAQQPYLYLEVADGLVHLIGDELEKMAQLAPTDDVDEFKDADEYLCVQCDYISQTAGTCPQHGVALLEFSEYVSAKRSAGDPKSTWIAVLIIFAVIATITLLT